MENKQPKPDIQLKPQLGPSETRGFQAITSALLSVVESQSQQNVQAVQPTQQGGGQLDAGGSAGIANTGGGADAGGASATTQEES